MKHEIRQNDDDGGDRDDLEFAPLSRAEPATKQGEKTDPPAFVLPCTRGDVESAIMAYEADAGPPFDATADRPARLARLYRLLELPADVLPLEPPPTLCPHCGAPWSEHPMRWKTARGWLRCNATAANPHPVAPLSPDVTRTAE